MNIGFPHKHADEKVPETAKFEISIKPVEKVCVPDKQDCDKSYEKHIGKNLYMDRGKGHNKEYEKDCVKDNCRNYDKDCGKDNSKDYKKDCGKDREKDYEKDCGKDREKDYEKYCGKDRVKDYEKDYEKDCGKDREKDYEKDCGKDREKDYEKDCGKDREKDYEKDWRKDHEKDYEKDWRKDHDKNCGKDCDKENSYNKNKNFSICADYYCISEEITVKSCDDLVCFNLGENFFKQNGFILELSLKFKDVCPNRHTALAVVLYELDKCEKECIRGFKTVLLPPTGKCVCSDISVNCLRFVIPQALDQNDNCNSCGPRKFVVRFIANYANSDFKVCGCEY